MLRWLLCVVAVFLTAVSVQAQDWPAARPVVNARMVALGNTPRYETLEQFKATVKRDRARWAEIVKAVGAKVD